MAAFQAQAITQAAFSGLAGRLTDGFGLFVDGPYHYAVADSNVFRIDVVRRTSAITFSQTIARLPGNAKVVINGNYFTGSALYARAFTGVVPPGSVHSQGEVIQGGALVLPDAASGADFFYFGRDDAGPPQYLAGGPSNPPRSLHEGMGGLGPILLPNPVTGTPLRFGAGNRYMSDSFKLTPPANDDEWRDCLQRNNNTYASIHAEALQGTGFCAVAAVPAERLLLLLAKPHGMPGGLDELREKLFDIGCPLACFTDGSNSTTMAVDRQVVPHIAPATFKDNLIETGFVLFRYRALPAAKVRVTFNLIEVIDDEELFGGGTWTVLAQVQTNTIRLLDQAEVASGDRITMSKSIDVTVPSGQELMVRTGAEDVSDGDDAGFTQEHYPATLSPKFGEGKHELKSSTGSYSVTYTIELIP